MAMVSPAANDQRSVLSDRLEPIVVIRPYRRHGAFHCLWIGISPGKQVRHAEGAVTPPFGEIDATGDRVVVHDFIRDARVQSDELDVFERLWINVVGDRECDFLDGPFAPEGVTVATIWRENALPHRVPNLR